MAMLNELTPAAIVHGQPPTGTLAGCGCAGDGRGPRWQVEFDDSVAGIVTENTKALR
jgi:hypothetical protein